MTYTHNPITKLNFDLFRNYIPDLVEDSTSDEGLSFEIESDTHGATGEVLAVKDGIALVSGIEDVMLGELLYFPTRDVFALALNLELDQVGCIIFGNDSLICQGDLVERTHKLANVPVGESLLGRVINGLGEFIDVEDDDDEKESSEKTTTPTDVVSENDSTTATTSLDENKEKEIKINERWNIERKAPGVITRESVNEPLTTGYKIIDSLLPIGRGQRELIIGDRQTGKTTLAIDSILAQRWDNDPEDTVEMACVYVGVGQRLLDKIEVTRPEAKKYFFIGPSKNRYLPPYNGLRIVSSLGTTTRIIIHTKSMHTLSKNLTKKSVKVVSDTMTQTEITKRYMATLTINRKAKPPLDPQADINNPDTKKGSHLEVHREQCAQTSCKEKYCNPICNKLEKREAIAHMTHGQSPLTESDKQTHFYSLTDLNGQPKQQNIVCYGKPHLTPKTLEHHQGTQQLQNDPKLQQIIIDHAKK